MLFGKKINRVLNVRKAEERFEKEREEDHHAQEDGDEDLNGAEQLVDRRTQSALVTVVGHK